MSFVFALQLAQKFSLNGAICDMQYVICNMQYVKTDGAPKLAARSPRQRKGTHDPKRELRHAERSEGKKLELENSNPNSSEGGVWRRAVTGSALVGGALAVACWQRLVKLTLASENSRTCQSTAQRQRKYCMGQRNPNQRYGHLKIAIWHLKIWHLKIWHLKNLY